MNIQHHFVNQQFHRFHAIRLDEEEQVKTGGKVSSNGFVAIVAIPTALEDLLRVELSFQGDEFREFR